MERLAIVAGFVAGFLLIGYIVWYVVLRWTRMPPLTEPQPSSTEERLKFETLDSMLSGTQWARGLLMKLARAGIGLRPSEFVGMAGGVSILLALALYLIVRVPSIVLFGLALGIAGSWVYLEVKCARRLALFNIQLPDALSLISSALRSGSGFEQAAKLVSKEMVPPISDEFARLLAETRVGVELKDSITHMVTRVKSYDLELAMVAVAVTRKEGGRLAEVLDKTGEMIRQRVRLQREVSALTVEGRMSGIVLLILPWVLTGLILTANPSYLSQMFTENVGKVLVGAAIGLQIIGALIIRRILRTDF